jgi:hypothetical protein
VKSLQWKDTLNYFSSNAFGKVKKLADLPTDIILRLPYLLGPFWPKDVTSSASTKELHVTSVGDP